MEAMPQSSDDEIKFTSRAPSEDPDQIRAHHSITSSAIGRKSRLIISPSALAVLRMMARAPSGQTDAALPQGAGLS